jgi:glutaredoxin
MKNIKFEERNLSDGGWTKEHLLEEIPTARSVPQIKIDGQYVGGFSELQNYLKGKV